MADNIHQRPIEQRGLKTMALWLSWALASLLILAELYQQANVEGFLLHDRTKVTWIIIGVFALAIAVSFYHVVLLTLEWFRAFRLESMISQYGLAGLGPLRRQRRHVERFIASTQAIMQREGHLDLESLVMVEFSAQHRLSQFVGLIGNLLITLGLIGTVLGMTLIMGGLNGAMNALGEDQKLMVESLGNAMSGMGVAFYTTLMGAVFGGILLRVFSWITDTSVDALQDLMLRTTLVYGSAEVAPGPGRELHVLDADLARLQHRVDLVSLACAASRKEVTELVGKMMQLQSVSKELAASDSMYRLAVHHAKYTRSVGRARIFGGWFAKNESRN